MSYLCKVFNFRRKWMKYKNIIKLRLPEIQLLAVAPTQLKFIIVKDHDEPTILSFETLFYTWKCFNMGTELSTKVMLGQTLVLMQMTFLNNARKVGRLVLSRTTCYIYYFVLLLCLICNWPSGCWCSTLIIKNWIELNMSKDIPVKWLATGLGTGICFPPGTENILFSTISAPAQGDTPSFQFDGYRGSSE
jgi:hypothetical protein